METQSPSPPSDFSITLSVNEALYYVMLLDILRTHGLEKFILPQFTDAQPDEFIVPVGTAFVAVIGYEPGVVPEINTPANHFLTELGLNEAIRLNRAILLFVRENPVGEPDKLKLISPDWKRWNDFRNRVLQDFPSESLSYSSVVLFKDAEDFGIKAPYAVQQLRYYLLPDGTPVEEPSTANAAQTKTATTRHTKPRTFLPQRKSSKLRKS